jgi:hypothetical protein
MRTALLLVAAGAFGGWLIKKVSLKHMLWIAIPSAVIGNIIPPSTDGSTSATT